MAVFCKSYKNTLIRVFLHAEFISALKTEPKPTVFEKYVKNRKKNYHYFLFFVIFSISFKQNFLKPNESCWLDSVMIIHAYLFCYVYMYVSTLLVSDVFQLYITAYFPSLFFKNRGFFFELLICISEFILRYSGFLRDCGKVFEAYFKVY